MTGKRVLAAGAALAALALWPASAAFAGGSAPVTVRVEGLNRTLLKPTDAMTHAGSLTLFGAPSGKCSDASAAGALDAATHHRWTGTWETSFNDYEVTSILGEAHTFSSKDFWEIFVNNVAAQTGACEIKLTPGEQLLFAAVPDKGVEYPILLDAPRNARVGIPFAVRVLARTAAGLKDLAGAHVTGGGVDVRTGERGLARITPRSAGVLVLRATHPDYIRSSTFPVRVG
jgi:hypothetical protein